MKTHYPDLSRVFFQIRVCTFSSWILRSTALRGISLLHLWTRISMNRKPRLWSIFDTDIFIKLKPNSAVLPGLLSKEKTPPLNVSGSRKPASYLPARSAWIEHLLLIFPHTVSSGKGDAGFRRCGIIDCVIIVGFVRRLPRTA